MSQTNTVAELLESLGLQLLGDALPVVEAPVQDPRGPVACQQADLL